MAKNTKTPAMVLQELTVKMRVSPPTYNIVSSIMGTHENRFDYKVCVLGIEAKGRGTSKQIGKQNAAHNALMLLKDKGIYNPDENPVQELKTPSHNTNLPESPFKDSPNCIGPLKDICLENKIPDPIFTPVSDVGPPHSREFTFECSIASIKTVATGSTKKMAKQMAAKMMLERIKDILPDIAAQYGNRDDLKAISDTDENALQAYNEFFGSIIPDKSVKIANFSDTLKKLMDEHNLTFNDFREEFNSRNEEALKNILNKLSLTYKFYSIQDNPLMVSLTFSTDTPFTTIGVSQTLEDAKCDALTNAFNMMRVFMQM